MFTKGEQQALRTLRAALSKAGQAPGTIVSCALEYTTALQLIELAVRAAKQDPPPAPAEFCRGVEHAREAADAGGYLERMLATAELVEQSAAEAGLHCTLRGSRQYVEAVAEFRRRFLDRPGPSAVHTQRWPKALHTALHSAAEARGFSLNQLVALELTGALIDPATAWRPPAWDASNKDSSTSTTAPGSSGA